MPMAGNALIIKLVIVSPELWSPMYFLLSHLSVDEILFTTNITPNMLNSLLREDGSISIEGCFVQIFLLGCFTVTECFLLAIKSYDRYLAICIPLNYHSLMSLRRCNQLSFGAWMGGLTLSAVSCFLIDLLQFCGSNVIDHYFCDFPLLLQKSCTDSYIIETEIRTFSILVTLPIFLFICLTYMYIIFTILKIPSTKGKKKGFSTCSSHLMVVSMYYATLVAIYVVPTKGHQYNLNKILSLLYTVATPLLNPLIYSLRNKAIKCALDNAIKKKLVVR
ncbi:olfactory receptor 493-like [Bombina bombina]|uniref:olfactory receptor 493-like n=1 Tax=Bombina bombina TaxID=8345 RepID=UPI00235A82A4|nr:olfactory receptor 493-like [Bombina bombina]